jgi:hypothetical protein
MVIVGRCAHRGPRILATPLYFCVWPSWPSCPIGKRESPVIARIRVYSNRGSKPRCQVTCYNPSDFILWFHTRQTTRWSIHANNHNYRDLVQYKYCSPLSQIVNFWMARPNTALLSTCKCARFASRQRQSVSGRVRFRFLEHRGKDSWLYTHCYDEDQQKFTTLTQMQNMVQRRIVVPQLLGITVTPVWTLS